MAEHEKGRNSLWNTRWLREVSIPLAIILASVSLYLHPLFSNTENTFSVLNFIFEHSFETNQVFIWFALSCAAPIILLSIWFFTSYEQWRYYILFPMFYFIYEFCARSIDVSMLKSLTENIVFKFILTLLILGGLIIIDRIKRAKRLKSESPLLGVISKEDVYGNSKLLYLKLSQWMYSLEVKKEELSKEQLFKKLYQTRQVLDEENGLFISEQDRGSRNRKAFELVSSIILASIPFWYILSRLIPEGPKSYSFGWFYVHDHDFKNLFIFIWYISLKIFILIPLMIWFISCKAWWRHAILVPIILYTYQLWETLKQESNIIDQFELLKAAPAILFILGLVLFLSNRIKYQYKIYDLYSNMVKEINALLVEISDQKASLGDKKKELDSIKADNNPENLGKKRASLIKIKEAIIAELNAKNAD